MASRGFAIALRPSLVDAFGDGKAKPVATVSSSIRLLRNEEHEARFVVGMSKPITVGIQVPPCGTAADSG
jgi:hypothetical protein